MSVVTLRIVETVHYSAEFTIEELNELCEKHGIPVYDPVTDVLTEWLKINAREAIETEQGMLERIEHRSGDVQGQEWKWRVSR